MKKKRYIIFMFLLVLIICSACGNQNISDVNNTEHENLKGSITFTHFWSADEEIQELIDEFMEEYPGINVKVEKIPVANYLQVIETRLIAGEMTDVYSGWTGSSMMTLYEKDATVDLSNRLWVKTLIPRAKEAVTYGNKQMMLPMNVAVMGVAYNKEIFSKLDVEIPETYDEFIEICEKAKEAGYLPIATGSKDNSGIIYASWIMAATDIYSKDELFNDKVLSGEKSFNCEEWQRILNRYLDWIDKGYIPENQLATDRNVESVLDFVSGRSAMFLLGSWDLERIRAAQTRELDIGIFPFPGDKPGEAAVLAAVGEGLAVYSGSDNIEADMALIDFFARPDVNRRFNMAINSFSVIEGVDVNFDSAASTILPYLEQKAAWGFVDANWPRSVSDVFSRKVTELLAGKIDTNDLLNAVENQWETERLKDNK